MIPKNSANNQNFNEILDEDELKKVSGGILEDSGDDSGQEPFHEVKFPLDNKVKIENQNGMGRDTSGGLGRILR